MILEFIKVLLVAIIAAINPEWGYIWETLDEGTMGQLKEPILKSWSKLSNAKPECSPKT